MKRTLLILLLSALIAGCTPTSSLTEAEGVSSGGDLRKFALAEPLGNERQDVMNALPFFDQRDEVIRFREVAPNRRLFDPDGFKAGDLLMVELFSGVAMDAVVERVDVNVNGTISIRALLPEDQGHMMVTSTRQRCLATLLMPGHKMFYRIISDPASHRHFLIEMDSEDRDILEGEVADP